MSAPDKIARLKEMIGDESVRDVTQVKKCLQQANPLVIATAARVAQECGNFPEIPELLDRRLRSLMTKPAKADPACLAKVALADALEAVEYPEPEVFVLGVRHVQLEGAFGKSVDTAAELRSVCAAGLVRTGSIDQVMLALTDLLADAEPQPRVVAARNLGFALGSDSSEFLLRLKVLMGDDEMDVLEACFAGLINITPERSFAFAESYLGHKKEDYALAAALAMASSPNRQKAFQTFHRHYEDNIDNQFKEMILVPMALTRDPAAFEFLFELVEYEHETVARPALRALTFFKPTAEQIESLYQVVRERADAAIYREFESVFR